MFGNSLKRLLTTPEGKIFISIVLGLGIATLFRRTCHDKNCIVFKGSVVKEVEGKTFQYGDECFKYTAIPSKCSDEKKQLTMITPSLMAAPILMDPAAIPPVAPKSSSSSSSWNPFA